MSHFLHNLETDFIFVFEKFALNLCSVSVLLRQLFRTEMNLNLRTYETLRSIYFLVKRAVPYPKTTLKSNMTLFKKHCICII